MLKLKKILFVILIVIIALLLAAFIFINVCPGFGKKPSKKMQESYSEKTNYYKDGKFHNIKDFKLTVHVEGRSILIDPVLSEYSSPVSFTGVKGISDLPMKAEDLPEIDVVLISHDHYDHLDYETIKKIKSKVKKFCVPLGVESRLEGWGVDSKKINSMGWYDEVNVDGLSISLTQSQHYSGRSINDSNSTWWGGFFLKDEHHSFYYTGDTGMGDFFNDVHEKYGDVELIMADTGQYDDMWPYCHMKPEESLKSAEIMGAKYLIPVHWAGFVLANHPWYEPGEKISSLAKSGKVIVATPVIGETVQSDNLKSINKKWWREVI